MTVVGMSNLILDYYFFDNRITINGGGTVSNILANLSSMGMDTKIFGYYGSDILGKEAKRMIEEAGVDTSLLEMKDYKTKSFFIDSQGNKSSCPYCNNKGKNYKLRKNIEYHLKKDDIVLIQDYVFLEKISNKLCLDFGYFGNLIYMNKDEIENFIFHEFYIVSIKDKVLSFILRKLNLTFDQFKKKMNIYFLIITKGKKGATIVFANNVYDYEVIPLKEKETNGCGDIFFATFISEIIKKEKITKIDIDEIFELAQKNVVTVLNNIGARNHIVKNEIIKKNEKCICEDFSVIV
ncbi:MAG: hypothetical protein HFJ02_04395 [Bacilli bacterium]|nr:hypothetical protein [Bacilli bacterium]